MIFTIDSEVALKSAKLKVTIYVTNIGTQGYPGTGKTSVLNLITGRKSDFTTKCSTDFIESSSQRMYMVTKSGSAGDEWEEITTDKMAALVCQAIKMEIVHNSQKKEDKSISIDDEHQPSHTLKTSSSLALVGTAVAKSSSSTSNKHNNSISIQAPVDTATRPSFPSPQENNESLDPYSAFPDLLRQLYSITSSGHCEIFRSHWMVVTDCGGQPPFLDAAALFVRNRCLQLFPVKLNERLDQPPTFSYFVNGELVSLEDIVVHPQTNLHVLETLAKSVAGIHSIGTQSGSDSHKKSKFITVGTFYDERESCDETVKKKEEILKDILKPYKSIHVYDGDVIVPINAATKNEGERKKFAAKLRKLIDSSNTAIKYEVKLCYFILLLSMNNMSKKEKKAILHIDDCIKLGHLLNMDKSETTEAIHFFHNIGRIMYFDDTCPHDDDTCPSFDLRLYVVIDDEPVLKRVSRLLSVSFIRRECFDDDYRGLKGLFSKGSSSDSGKNCLSFETQKKLQDHGEFDRKELKFLKLTEEELDFFLAMLQHVKAIAKISSGKYFMPCALPYAKSDVQNEILSGLFKYAWAIKFQRMDEGNLHMIPVPIGYLSALVVILVTDFSSDFSTVDKRQYRNCVTLRYKKEIGYVYIVECHLQLEVYFSHCQTKDYTIDCSVIREVVLEAMVKTDERLRISVDKIDCFLCSCGKDSSHHFCTYYTGSNVECEIYPNTPLELKDKQRIWISPGMHAHAHA